MKNQSLCVAYIGGHSNRIYHTSCSHCWNTNMSTLYHRHRACEVLGTQNFKCRRGTLYMCVFSCLFLLHPGKVDPYNLRKKNETWAIRKIKVYLVTVTHTYTHVATQIVSTTLCVLIIETSTCQPCNATTEPMRLLAPKTSSIGEGPHIWVCCLLSPSSWQGGSV